MSIVCEHARVHDSTRKQNIFKQKLCCVFVCILFVCYVLLVCEYGSEQNAAKQIYSQFITYVVRCIIIAHGHHMLHMIYCVGSRNGSTSLTLTLALCFLHPAVLPSCTYMYFGNLVLLQWSSQEVPGVDCHSFRTL